jgi:hypothetical protein
MTNLVFSSKVTMTNADLEKIGDLRGINEAGRDGTQCCLLLDRATMRSEAGECPAELEYK